MERQEVGASSRSNLLRNKCLLEVVQLLARINKSVHCKYGFCAIDIIRRYWLRYCGACAGSLKIVITTS
ncbi:unnamed protein product [Calypogeia fissa]